MSLFLTGSTGYLGSYIATGILREHKDKLALLVRAKNQEEGRKRLWKSLQLHMDFEEFQSYLKRMDIYLGDLTQPNLGLDKRTRNKLVRSMDSVIHCAASLNRKSAKSCFNVNLRGTLEVIKMAKDANEHHGVRRFSDISTVATCGHRKNEVVTEDKAIQWDLSDYDPYARTKKFCEHMVHELLPQVEATVFRPSIILGDSRIPETTQFDMVRAFVMLAQMPVLPFRPEWRLDIVPANYVGASVVKIHQQDKPLYDAYNLSAGRASLTYQQVVCSMEQAGFARKHHFMPALEGPFTALVDGLAMTPRKWGVSLPASL
ncbi:MAG TPA: NAD-dependent epimerase/dehydratase family protein, partial [Myxococcales bacterium]|nr:NAD-dependent epimerase/dehydratase family protein [Myxococcales bacterium]